MGRSENTYRRILGQVPGKTDKLDIAELARQLSEMVYALEGRRGPVKGKDQLDVDASERHTPLKFKGKGLRGAGAIAFSGRDNASMYVAKGAYMDDRGNWIAQDSTVVILELNRDSATPQMYRNTNLNVGQVFRPEAVGHIAIGDSEGTPIDPGTGLPIAGDETFSTVMSKVSLGF